MSLTTPSIFDAQNTVGNKRLVAAQARSYSDAKIVFSIRVIAVAVLGLTSSILAVVFPAGAGLIGGLGGFVILVLALVVRSLEKTFRTRAAAIQEEFDTRIFQLAWNRLRIEHPSPNDIARLAARYRGGRAANWYDPTDNTRRPFDVLICQEANLGWAAPMHWIWAWILVGAGGFVVAGIVVAESMLKLPADKFALSLVIPFAALFKELIEQVMSNFEVAREKRALEHRIGDYWRAGIAEGFAPTAEQLRSIQDRLLDFRLSNPYVPDWLDTLFHRRNEAAMRTSVSDRNAEALRAGLVG